MNPTPAPTPLVFIAGRLRLSLAVFLAASPLCGSLARAETAAITPVTPLAAAGIAPIPAPATQVRPPLLPPGGVRPGDASGIIRPNSVRGQARELYSTIRYAFYCFGPLFGNDSRDVDPNYMPPPTAVFESGPNPSGRVVHYTRVPDQSSSQDSDRTTWIGSDGSRISYLARKGSERSGATDAGPEQENAPSVAELIAENRREMTKISWARVFRRYPELNVENSPEREEFERYLFVRRADPAEAATFENPMWPERLASTFMVEYTADRNWKRAEAESWDRVRERVRIFNDPESIYTRRFLQFAASLRDDPEGAAIFKEPDWPEKVLELHNRRFGEVPARFR